MRDDSYVGRLIIVLIFGPPMAAVNLLSEKEAVLSLVVFSGWLCLSMYAISYLSKKRIVRRWLSVPITIAIAVSYLSFYASLGA